MQVVLTRLAAHANALSCPASNAGVVVGDDVIPADDVIIAMGPWSQSARAWLPLPSISGQKYHSVVLRPHTPVTAHMIFTGFKLANGRWGCS